MFTKSFFTASFLFLLSILPATAQELNEAHRRIIGFLESGNRNAAFAELRQMQRKDGKTFRLNNYDYLAARLAEERGEYATANALYLAVVKRNSALTAYALWRLSQIARAQVNMTQERVYLRQILIFAPDSLLFDAAIMRLAQSFFESRDFNAAIAVLHTSQFPAAKGVNTPIVSATPTPSTAIKLFPGNDVKTREKLVLLGRSYLQGSQQLLAREVFNKLLNNLPNPAMPDDFALAAAQGLDTMDTRPEDQGKQAPALSPAEHWKRASVYQFNRDFPAARLHYLAIVERHSTDPMRPQAIYQLGRGHAQENNFEAAIPWFERAQNEFPNDDLARDALSQAASAYSRLGKQNEALNRYRSFIQKYPDADNLDRAYFNIVDITRDQNESNTALNWAAQARDKFKGEPQEAIALFAQARIFITQNDWTNALMTLDALKDRDDLGGTRFPGGTNTTEVSFMRAYVLEQMSRMNEAINSYLAITDGRAEYYGWRATERLRGLAADPRAADLIATKLADLRQTAAQSLTAGSYEQARQAAQTALRLTNDQAAINYLLEIARKAYAQLPAYQKVPTGALQTFGRQAVLEKKEKIAVAPDAHQASADELLFLGLYDEAAPELETALRVKYPAPKDPKTGQAQNNSLGGFPPEIAYTLAVFYKRGNMAHRAVGYIEPLWRQVPADYLVQLAPRESIELLYPAPYADSLLKHGPSRNVDPRFLLAIMRQESRFRADVKSVAAARGLMQFISTTSSQLAPQLGKQGFRQDELYHPPTAILFGSQYVNNLFTLFPSQPPAVAAAYNAGESAMTRWQTRSRSDQPDRYVPEILFTQSKDYVYKVMANYRVYQTLYDESLLAK